MFTNSLTRRIEWGDCDPAGIVFYPRYFAMFDSATSMLFEKALGMTKYQFLKHYNFVGYPMVDTRAQFHKPTRFGDDVTIETSIALGKSSFDITHKLSLNGDLAVECTEKRVWVVRDPADESRIKPQAIPDEVRKKLGAQS